MKPQHLISVLMLIVVLLSSVLLSCGPGKVTYDPAKTYAAVIAIDLPAARTTLDDIRQKSSAEGFDVGPVEYYQPGQEDFVPIIKRLTSEATIGMLWIASGLEDIPGIQAAVAKAGYTGQVRLMPVYPPSPYHP